jgi:hypothetical protein
MNIDNTNDLSEMYRRFVEHIADNYPSIHEKIMRRDWQWKHGYRPAKSTLEAVVRDNHGVEVEGPKGGPLHLNRMTPADAAQNQLGGVPLTGVFEEERVGVSAVIVIEVDGEERFVPVTLFVPAFDDGLFDGPFTPSDKTLLAAEAFGSVVAQIADESDTINKVITDGGADYCMKCRDKPSPPSSTVDEPLCADCRAEMDTAERTSPSPDVPLWGGVNIYETTTAFPESHTERDRWMGHSDKMPFAPWGERDHPTADPDDDARWKWGIEDNHRSFEKADMGTVDKRVDGLAYIQEKESDFVYVDGDDVRDPETRDIHPAFLAILNHLGETYADVSTSGAGVHAVYKGELPRDEVQVKWELDDDPWGSNDEIPEVEIYSTKRVLVMTGDKIAGSDDTANPWDDGVLPAMLDAAGYGEHERTKDDHPVPPERRNDYAFDDYDPDTTDADEQASDMRDIFHALDRLDPKQVAEDTIVHRWNSGASTSDSMEAFYPSWDKNCNGTANVVGDRGWHDAGGGGGGGPAVMAAIDIGEMRPRNARPRDLTGAEWAKAVDHLRELGYPIPEWPGSVDTNPVSQHDGPLVDRVLLPPSGKVGSFIGWGVNDKRSGELSQQEVYDRTQQTIERAMEKDSATLVHGIMGCGKTYSAFAAAVQRDEPILYAAMRSDLYEQGEEYARENEVAEGDQYTLPSINRDCPTACGEEGEGWVDRVHALQGLGVQPKAMHALLDMPCDNGGECPYRAKMKFEPDDCDVLIGHYTHAHLPQFAKGRHVIVDENPADAYFETIEGNELVQAVNTFLGFEKSPDIEDFHDLLNAREDPERVQAGEDWFEMWAAQEEWKPDQRNAVDHEMSNYHALTPHAVYGILTGEQVGDDSPRYRTVIDGRNPIVFRDADEDDGYEVTVNTPPSEALSYARSVVGLDGTPMLLDPDSDDAGPLGRVPEWDLALNQRFSISRVLSDDERGRFLTETQDINLIQTTEHIKPYSSGKHRNRDKDFALIEGAAREYDHQPTVFTTKAVREEYEQHEDDIEGGVRDWNHFGNLRGSDKYAEHRLGIILGSPHYGDEWLADRAALLGRSVSPEGKGEDRGYGNAVGNALLETMREATVAQAALRFGRDGNGARVLLHTAAIPDWLPVQHEGAVINTWNDAQRKAINRLQDGFNGDAEELAEHLPVGVRQTRNILCGLRDCGIADYRRDPEDGRRYEWTADEVGDVAVYGETSLPEAPLEDGEEDRRGSLREVSVTARLATSHTVYDRPRDSEPASNDDAAPDAQAEAD